MRQRLLWTRLAPAAALIAAVAAVQSGAFSARSQVPAPVTWQTMSAGGFSARLASGKPLEGIALSDLRAALASEDPEVATRAAVLLALRAADQDEAATWPLLMETIERHDPRGARSEVGRDIVAARGLLPRAKIDAALRARLALQSSGPSPHPRLAVRVECARTCALTGGLGNVSAFLLAVLRAETPDESKSPPTWERITTLAWAKTRAAEALSEAIGTDCRFRADGSWQHQAAEASRLEALLPPR